MSFLLVGEDLDECLVEGILAEGFDGRRHAVHVLAFHQTDWDWVLFDHQRLRLYCLPVVPFFLTSDHRP
jgi:hypothetical protein